MLQKNPVFKKLAALTLSASVCTTVVGAKTPSKKKEYNSDIIKYAGYTVAAVIVTSGCAYLGWAQLFVNKVLTAAENLAKELNKQKPNAKKVKKLSMEFYKLLHEATEETTETINEEKNEFGQENYEKYADKDECKNAALALIAGTLTTSLDVEEEITKNATQKIKVNRLRYVDRDKLKTDLDKMFQTEKKKEEEEKSESSTKSTSKSSNSSKDGSDDEEKTEKKEKSKSSTKSTSKSSSSSEEKQENKNNKENEENPEDNKEKEKEKQNENENTNENENK